MVSPPEPAVPAYRTLRLPRKHRQVLGLGLNCSESKGAALPYAPSAAACAAVGPRWRRRRAPMAW